MVLMALDHVRDFFHQSQVNATDLAATSVLLFLTRWMTHFCAPIFVFLAGVGAFLHGQRQGNDRNLSRYLAGRGVWLILLEFTWVKWSWGFNFNYQFVSGQVIWALGVSMVCLAGLIRLPRPVWLLLGSSLILFHNAFDFIQLEQSHPLFALWSVLHGGQLIPLGSWSRFFPLYPLIPWIGVMALGYGFGAVFLLPDGPRQRLIARWGMGLTAGFLVLRWTNLYGDPQPWSQALSWDRMVLSFVNCNKYPPSLLYLCMTLGPGLWLLSWLDGTKQPLPGFFITFGQVPLLYYLLHIPLIHLLSAIAASLFGTTADSAFIWSHAPFRGAPETFGYPLGITYVTWVAVVSLLYPVCHWYQGYKRQHRHLWWTKWV